MFTSPSTVLASCAMALSIAGSALAHSNMFEPTPRADVSHAFVDSSNNACENDNTGIPDGNNFQRGQTINPKWWWNNHNGGFVKFALTQGIGPGVPNTGFLANENIIAAQCYTGGCDQSRGDPGNTLPCIGKPFVIPDWVENGEYILQWSHIGGFNSEGIVTKQLPLYHTCANIRINDGGLPLQPRPADWIAPFTGGSQDVINGQQGGNDVCGFKKFRREPANPAEVNVNEAAFDNNMEFGVPDGWAVAGATNSKRADNLMLPRLGHVARAIRAD